MSYFVIEYVPLLILNKIPKPNSDMNNIPIMKRVRLSSLVLGVDGVLGFITSL